MANFYGFYPPAGGGSNASVGANGVTAPSSSTEIGGINPGGNLQPLQTDNSGNLLVSIAAEPGAPIDVHVTQTVSVSDDQAAGNINNNSTLQIHTFGYATAGISISGSWTGTIVLEGSVDGSTYTPINGVSTSTGAIASTYTANATIQVSTSGFQLIRLRGVSVTGPASCTIEINATTSVVALGDSLPTGANTIGVVGITGVVPLPTGAATSANQTSQITQETAIAGSTASIDTKSSTISTNTGNTATSVASIDTKTPTVGQKAMSGSRPVVLASDQTSIPVAATIQAGSAIIGKVSIDQTTPGTTNGVVVNSSALPSGAATAANQTSTQGSVSGGTAATSSQLDGGVFNSTLPTLTNGQQAAIQLDSSGRQLVTDSAMADLYFTGQSAQTATINNIIPAASSANATDALGFHAASIQVISTGTGGTYIFEGSNDNVNFQTIPVYSQLILTGTPIVAAITATSSNLIYTFPIQARYIRLRIATTITGGSIQAFTRLTQTPFTPAVTQVAQTTAANLNVTAAGTVTANQGTAAVIANSWYAKLSDATTGPVKVQAASTAPAAADLALTVALSPNGVTPKASGRGLANAPTVTTYGTPITSSTYVTIIASTTSATNLVEVFDSSGVALYFATGAAASEVNQFIIYPGGNGQVPLAIPAGTRISYKAVSTSASGASAFNILNLYT